MAWEIDNTGPAFPGDCKHPRCAGFSCRQWMVLEFAKALAASYKPQQLTNDAVTAIVSGAVKLTNEIESRFFPEPGYVPTR